LSVITRLMGRTTSELGAIPMLHIMLAPIQTCIGIGKPSARWLQGILAKPDTNATAGRTVVAQSKRMNNLEGNPFRHPGRTLVTLRGAPGPLLLTIRLVVDEGDLLKGWCYGQDQSNFRHVAHRSTKVVARD
jgi:hypothetical protein